MSIHKPKDNGIEKVAIITPCYNAAKYIKETYESLRLQKYGYWEWIIFDDMSSDNSLEVLSEISSMDERVKVFQNTKNQGAATTRNNCLQEADATYVAFLDCDDLWDPTKLEKQVHFMQENSVDFSYHNYRLIDDVGSHLKNLFVARLVTAKDLLKYNPFATSSILIRKSLLDQNQIRFKEHLRRRQDYLFWYEAILTCNKAYGIPEVLSSYRVFGGESLSANKKKMALIQWSLYRNEFNLNLFQTIYYFGHYAIHGLKKYFLS